MRQLRASLRRLRAERRQLPRVAPFVPVVLRHLVSRRRRGARDPLQAAAARLAPGSRVVQLPPVVLSETLALASGCRASGARLVAVWPADAPRAAFREWHRTVVLAGLLPHVEIAAEAETDGAALVHPAS